MAGESFTVSHARAVRWMKDHGGDAAVVRVKGGGRYLLAWGEHAPFMPSTCRALINMGLAQYVDENGRKAVRFKLTERGWIIPN